MSGVSSAHDDPASHPYAAFLLAFLVAFMVSRATAGMRQSTAEAAPALAESKLEDKPRPIFSGWQVLLRTGDGKLRPLLSGWPSWLSAPRPRPPTSRVTLDVGGQLFSTTVATLSGTSGYFRRVFSQAGWEEAALVGGRLFLDRDADAFKVLLSCMRHRRCLLPEADKDLCTRVLLEARYFEVGWLLRAVKHTALQNVEPPAFDDGGLEAGSSAWLAAYRRFEADLEQQQHDPRRGAAAFDARFGGLEGALDLGVLPDYYYAEEEAQIRQLLPASAAERVVFTNGDRVRRVRAIAYALVEEAPARSTHIDAVISPRDDPEGLCEEQFVLASRYAHSLPVASAEPGWSWSIQQRPDSADSHQEGEASRDKVEPFRLPASRES